MAKNEIKEVLRKEVRQAWEVLKDTRSLFGDDDIRTEYWKGEWETLSYLWYELFPNEDY